MGRTVIAAFAAALLLSTAAAGEYLPLETGNYWSYRSEDGRDGFKITVGLPFLIGGKGYYSLRGFTDVPLLVRQNEEGDLVWLDEENERELPLVRFGNPETPYRMAAGVCEVQAEVSGRRVPYEGPAVMAAGALEVRYQPVNCADAGFERELYLDNIGLARRTVTTIAGPRTYELAAARVGKWSFAAAPGAVVRLTLDPPSVVRASEADPIRFEAELRISLFGMEPLRLRYPTSQRYDLVLRDDGRRVVYRWSEGRMFLQAVGEEEVAGERAYTIHAETPGGLPDGAYQVEVWLTTDDNPRFAASGAITVETAR